MTGSSLIEQLTTEAARDGIDQLVVRAVIARDHTVLQVRRAAHDFLGGCWELPGGKVDPGETLEQALVREAHEETGLRVTMITGYLGYLDFTSRTGRRMRQFNFTVDVAAYGPVVLAEHDRYRWLPVNGDPTVAMRFVSPAGNGQPANGQPANGRPANGRPAGRARPFGSEQIGDGPIGRVRGPECPPGRAAPRPAPGPAPPG